MCCSGHCCHYTTYIFWVSLSAAPKCRCSCYRITKRDILDEREYHQKSEAFVSFVVIVSPGPQAQHLLPHELVDGSPVVAEARHGRQLFEVTRRLCGDENAQAAEVFLIPAHFLHPFPSKRQVVIAERITFPVLPGSV